MASLFDRVKVATATTGTGTITLGAAVRSSSVGDFLTFTEAGVADGDTVSYFIQDGANWASGQGIYTASGLTLTRDANETRWNGSLFSTTPLNLSGTAVVYLTALAADIVGGPAFATDTAIARFDGTNGRTLQTSSATLDDDGNITASRLASTTGGFTFPDGSVQASAAAEASGAGLVLGFAGEMDSRITVTRASGGSRINSSGLIEYASADAPRFNYWPATSLPRGIAIEPASVNLIEHHNERLAHTSWGKGATTVTENDRACPDGSLIADKITVTTGGAFASSINRVVTIAANTTHAYSFFRRYIDTQWEMVLIYNGSHEIYCWVDMLNGAIGSNSVSGSATFSRAYAEQYPDGWWRFTVVGNLNGGVTSAYLYNASAASNGSTTTVTGSRHCFGAQHEAGEYSTSYMPIRNYVLYSEDFTQASYWILVGSSITGNAWTSPDGELTLDKLVETATTIEHEVYVSAFGSFLTAGAGPVLNDTTIHETKFLARAGERRYVLCHVGNATNGLYAWSSIIVDLLTGEVTDQADGSAGTMVFDSAVTAPTKWPGVWEVTFRAHVTSGTFSSVGFCTYDGPTSTWVELGGTGLDFAGVAGYGVYIGRVSVTSKVGSLYHQTGATNYSRAADVVSMTSTNFSNWFTAAAGTLIIEGDCPAVGTRPLISMDDNTANEQMRLYASGTTAKFTVTDGGATQADIDAGTVAARTGFRMAAAFSANDFAASAGGAGAGTDTAGTVPTVTRMRIGADQAGNYLAGHIKSITFISARRSNAALARATASGEVVQAGTTTVNFGAFPGASDASVTITGQTGIAAGSRVKAWIQATDTADHSADEHWLETIDVVPGNITARTGFTIYAKNTGTLSEPVGEQWANTRLAGPGTGINQIRPDTGGGKGTRLYGQFTVGWEWI